VRDAELVKVVDVCYAKVEGGEEDEVSWRLLCKEVNADYDRTEDDLLCDWALGWSVFVVRWFRANILQHSYASRSVC
jgi:hypothetical protein